MNVGDLIGNYRLVKKLDQGGFSHVYLYMSARGILTTTYNAIKKL